MNVLRRKVLNRKALNVISLGLALGAALAHPLAITVAQAQVDPTVQQTNWAQAQPVDVSALRSHQLRR